MGWAMKEAGFDSWQGHKIYFLGAHPASYTVNTWGCFHCVTVGGGVKWQSHEADHSPILNLLSKQWWIVNIIPLSLNLWGKRPATHYIGPVWAPQAVWKLGRVKSLSLPGTQPWFPGHPACSPVIAPTELRLLFHHIIKTFPYTRLWRPIGMSDVENLSLNRLIDGSKVVIITRQLRSNLRKQFFLLLVLICVRGWINPRAYSGRKD
jgi:hypothetical protein